MRTLIILTLALLVSCNDTSTNTTLISILEDKTEKDFAVRLQPQQVIKLFGLKSNKWQGLTFRYQSITHVRYNQVKQARLLSESSALGNEFQRDQAVAIFSNEVTTIIQDSTVVGRSHSAIFKPLIKEIIHLQQDTLTNAKVYLVSDLQENTPDFFSVYNPYDLKKLKKTPGKVQELFLVQTAAVNRSMKHIEVVVVYEPTTVLEDQHFAMMVTLYQAVFKTLNIPISFQSNF